jgi:chromosome transmission fidelity protein 8
MPTIPLHPPQTSRHPPSSTPFQLPQLLQTPLGIAIVEIQGTINIPTVVPGSTSTRVGKLVFPDYDAERDGANEGSWMKKVWFYVGYQRMLGEVKRLNKPLGIVGRRGLMGKWDNDAMDVDQSDETASVKTSDVEELEIFEIVKWKILFSSRPEPVGDGD